MIVALQTLLYFRESLLAVIARFLGPYYKSLALQFRSEESDDEESEYQVFADFDEEKGVVFYPPVYAQRYAAVSDCLMDDRWYGRLEKVVEFGYHDMSFIKYLKEVKGVKYIIGVDLESIPLRCSADLLGGDDYLPKREHPLNVVLFQGNAADPDYRLIGCDAVVSIEMIEHMLPHDLERLVHTVFGFIKPRIAVFTTPNGDFNVLFKSLQKNGLRRLDHFFEWSREQFHDWCTNIVLRYSNYEVTTKGIGPGPEGTIHFGCCSQMALFVAKEYHKQQDLNLNSLALVSNAPSPANITELVGICDSPEYFGESNMNLGTNVDSQTEFLYDNQSRVTILLGSPPYSCYTFATEDKTSQCNLENELGKNFLMFNEEDTYSVKMPSRKVEYRVYEIEDVASRLNCTTLQVTKFSKTTQKLMAKNKIDTLVHTRAVVDEIKHLTKMLNFDKDKSRKEQGDSAPIWNNINWGENAPYWNQYYKVVKEYNYPFETKSEECRILDLISDEMNRLIDMQFDEELSGDMSKLEVPLEYLMRVVEPITNDIDRVREILEWNGYEVVDDVVIHTRLLVDDSTVTADDDWQENDSLSDLDKVDIRSTSLSEASSVAVDYQGRYLRRALDRKVRKLRSTLSADEDITFELDRVVCRLMKLALRTSKGRQMPPPPRWMQCKLYDLLTLTEKAIERRKMHFINNFQIGALCGSDDQKSSVTFVMDKFKKDSTAQKIMQKYDDLLNPKESVDVDLENDENYDNYDFDVDDMVYTSYDEYQKGTVYQETPMAVARSFEIPRQMDPIEEDTPLDRTQAWLDEDVVNEISYQKRESNSGIISSGDTDTSTKKTTKKYKKKQKGSHCKTHKGLEAKIWKRSQSKISNSKTFIMQGGNKVMSYQYENYDNAEWNWNRHSDLQSTDYKPISDDLAEISPTPTDAKAETIEQTIVEDTDDSQNVHKKVEDSETIATTEESVLIDIVMDGMQETIALKRTIGTDADVQPNDSDDETFIGEVNDFTVTAKHQVSTENIESQSIFLYDLNEPTTSKGVRHHRTDVLCGPDTSAVNALSVNTSLTVVPKNSTDMKIGDSLTNFLSSSRKSIDFGTCTHNESENYKLVSPRTMSVGIKIKDSDTKLEKRVDSGTMTQEMTVAFQLNTEFQNDTHLIKAVSSKNMEDSGSEFRGSFASIPKSLVNYSPSTGTSECKGSVRSKLSCGGVHVHSFKEKNILEDVIYQGQWQHYKARKNSSSPLSTRNISRASMYRKNSLKSSEIITTKSRPNSANPPTEASGKSLTSNRSKSNMKNPVIRKKTVIPNKNLNRVSSKASLVSCKIQKKSLIPKKTPIKPSVLAKEKEKKEIKKEVVINKVTVENNKHLKSKYSKLKPKIISPSKKEEAVLKVNDNKINIDLSIICNPEDLKTDLLKFRGESPRRNVNYAVFRNEVKHKSSEGECESPPSSDDRITKKEFPNRELSATSRDSSPCSSPNSVSTIKAMPVKSKPIPAKQNAASSNKRENSDPSNSSKAKKYTKRIKNSNNTENKENLSNSSTSSNLVIKEANKPKFSGRNKNIFIAQLNTETSVACNVSKNRSHPSNKSAIKLPSITAKRDMNKSNKVSPTLSKKSTVTADEPHSRKNSVVFATTPNIVVEPNDVAVSEPKSEDANSSSEPVVESQSSSNTRPIFIPLNSFLPDTADDKEKSISHTSVASDIKNMIEGRLNFIDNNLITETSSPNETQHIESPIAANIESEITPNINVLEISLDRTFDTLGNESVASLADTVVTLTDNTDMMSFKSLTSTSKMSEYFLADAEYNDRVLIEAENISSVKDLFERKDPLQIQAPSQPSRAAQALSGLTINTEPVVGDQPDFVNLVDSETGSIAVTINRQANSEELFMSGLSSESFTSALDDNVVPNWLFQLMNQVQEPVEEESDSDEPAPLLMPMEIPHEPLFDVNGNMVEPPAGLAAGAGDGRGIHSDYSQDSSGRGSSLSSSQPSSDPDSETILIDPTAFTSQYVAYRNASEGSTVPNSPPEASSTALAENGDNEEQSSSRRRRPLAQANSEFDADESSLDTDPPDLSDN